MARPRPTSVTVMGILNIVFGSLLLLCGVCAGVLVLLMLGNNSMFNVGGVNPVRELMDGIKREIPAYPAVIIASTVGGLILNALLIVAGIGLLKMQGWARVLSIIYSVITILEQIGMLIFTIAIVNPAMSRVEHELERRFAGRLPPGAMGGDSMAQNIGNVIGALLGMTYAIILLIMMLLPRVRAALSAGPPLEESLADRYEESGEEYERKRDPWNY